MLQLVDSFPGFSVDDIDAARTFYGEVLGLSAEKNEMGALTIVLGSGQSVFVYPKPNHTPASFTILNFIVDDLSGSVDALNAQGVVTKIYTAPDEFGTDERGIAWSSGDGGPNIAWFRDPAGNVLSLIESS